MLSTSLIHYNKKITVTLPVSFSSIMKDLSFSKFQLLCENQRMILSESLSDQVIDIYKNEDKTSLNRCLVLIIKHNIEIFNSNINYYLLDGKELDNELIEIIFNDNEVPISTKVTMIKAVWPSISEVFWDNITINNEILLPLIPHFSEDSIKLSFFTHALENGQLITKVIENCLHYFKNTNYNLITNRSRRAKIPSTDENIRLLNLLKSYDYISSFSNNGE
ncbi:hypothetical protein B738_09671 [Photorhabdus temperata subsp. temperata M1021]|nr:hypothetical protein B738_09671 [Photorhabdus temperata subsp. temperata M1021]